jgi:hypothetical protein
MYRKVPETTVRRNWLIRFVNNKCKAYLEQRTSYGNTTPYSSNEYSRHNVPLLKTTNPIRVYRASALKNNRLHFLYLNIHIIQSLIYYYYYTISVLPHSLLKFIIRIYTRFLFPRLHSYLTRIINQYTWEGPTRRTLFPINLFQLNFFFYWRYNPL